MFQDYYLSVLTKQYFQFDGRTSRREFWMFLLFNAIIVMGLLIVDYLLSGSLNSLIVTTIYRLAVIIPMTAIAVRRFHDTGHSGYALFWGLVPLFGAIYLIYLYCIEGQSWTNEYGEPVRPTENLKHGGISNQNAQNQHHQIITNETQNCSASDIRNKWNKASPTNKQTTIPNSSNSISDQAKSIRDKW